MIFFKIYSKFSGTWVLKLFVASIVMVTLSCKVQKTQTAFPKVENHLNGELDYAIETLELVQIQENNEEIRLGQINEDGTVHFNMPEFDIKALFDSIPLQQYNFQSLFLMQSCEGKDPFDETPFDAIYSKKYDPIYVKKYGKRVAVLYPVSNEKVLSNNQYNSDSLAVGSKYHWFYIDRAIAYKEECIKTSFNGTYDIEVKVSADIQFKKGWNFIEEKLVEIQNYSKNDYHTTLPKKIHFTRSSPEAKEVKWYLKQIMDDDKIQTAKKLFDLVPISKEQFEKWLPTKAGNLTRTDFEINKKIERSDSKKNAFLVFENGDEKMEVVVMDGVENPNDLEMVNFAFEMSEVKEDEGRYVSRYDESTKTSHILSVYKDRIVLMAKGENMTAEQLWKALKALDIASIID